MEYEEEQIVIKRYIASLLDKGHPSIDLFQSALDVIGSMTQAQIAAILTLQHMRITELIKSSK
jgi:hypothetical protein